MKSLHVTALVLLVVGGLNLGLVGLFNFDLIKAVFGDVSWLERLIYVLVGAAAVIIMVTHKQDCKTCVADDVSSGSQSTPPPPPTI